ncbi:MAG: 3-dehydroquinate synthase [Syntrophothermus sp.]
MKFSCHTSEATSCDIFTGKEAIPALQDFLSSAGAENIFILTDNNTHHHCLPLLLKWIPVLQEARVLTMPAGEEHKNIQTVAELWQQMILYGAGRKSLLVNLGGGVVTDTGGFIASTLKRGIPFVNIPTTLMGMVDAGIGGKNGINIGNLKNQSGTFCLPAAIFIDDVFLKTLPQTELLSGLGEIIKYGLISKPVLLENFGQHDDADLSQINWIPLIEQSVAIKNELVTEDFREKGRRAILNFGHTMGHAFESFSFFRNTPVSHGHAVAMGMVCELFLSVKAAGLDPEIRQWMTRLIFSYFVPVEILEDDFEIFENFLSADKKKSAGELTFALIQAPGKAVFGVRCDRKMILESLQDYLQMIKQLRNV